MFSRFSALIAVVLSVSSAVLATPAANSNITARKSLSGTATLFLQKGVAGACGKVHSDKDHIVALQTTTYAKGAHCGATITITDTKTGKTATGVVADECPTCNGDGSIDLSESLFEGFATKNAGVFPVTWHF